LNLNPAIWEAIAATGWRSIERGDEHGRRRVTAWGDAISLGRQSLVNDEEVFGGRKK
jgi:hypothetical protein